MRDKAALAEFAAPEIDDAVAEVWQRTLGVPAFRGDGLLDALAPSDGFARSHQLGRLLSEIHAATGVDLPLTVAFGSPTAAQLAAMIRNNDWPAYERPVPVHCGAGPRLFVLPGLGGIGLDTLPLVRRLTFSGSVYLNPPRGINGSEPHHTLDAVVADHISALRTIQPNGPYWLLGYSWGGLVAIEVARCLRASGETIAFVGMIDPILNMTDWTYSAWFDYLSDRLRHHLKELLRSHSPGVALRYGSAGLISTVDKIARLFGVNRFWPIAAKADHLPSALAAVWKAESELIKAHRMRYYAGKVTLFAIRSGHAAGCRPEKIWPSKVGQFDLQWVPGDHTLTGPGLKDAADMISAVIAAHSE